MPPQGPDDTAAFFAEFMDDYFADCDEHLREARRCLLTLEEGLAAGAPDPETVQALFRDFHTIKGLSGMVGLEPAEQLAHRLESYLGAIRDGRAPLTRQGFDALEAGVARLEAILAAKKEGAAIPGIEAELERLDAVLQAGPDAAPPPSAKDRPAPESAPPPDQSAAPETPPEKPESAAATPARWRFHYQPAPALAERGITVETIRARLQQLGRILEARPRIEGRSVRFEFVVETAAPEESFASWKDDGMSWEPVAEAAPVGTTPAAGAAEATPSPPPPAQTRASATPARPGEPGRSRPRLDPIVRVELGRLDELLRLVGELVITRGRLGDRLQQLHGRVDKALFRELEEAGQLLERQLRDLREGIMRVRMVPLAQAFERMQFAVRDLARETARHVRVVLRGEDTEVDKLVVERMLDPLLHLVRNAVSHGIEPPAERAAAGKPETATIELRAAAAGDTVVIEVADDGRGIGLEKVAARARRVGLLGPDEPLDPDRLIDILCAPGFSTREEADHAAGRGVGMSVVRNAVQELGGRLDVASQPGRGTTWRIQLPLTVLIMDAVLVEVADQILAMPQPALSEIRRIEADSIRQIQGGEIIPHRDRLLPLLRLNRVFHWPESKRSTLDVLVVGHEPDLLGLVVDRVLGQREIVVRALDDPLVRTPGIAGATEASDGRAVLILDAAGLVALAAGRRKLGSGSAATVSTPSRTP